MVWFIAACAVLVMVVAAFAATGHLGGLGKAGADTPGSGLPDDPAAPVDLDTLRFGKEALGYAPHSVDEFLSGVRPGTRLDPAEGERIAFPVSRPGYATAQVDAVIDRLVSAGAAGVAAAEPAAQDDVTGDRPVGVETPRPAVPTDAPTVADARPEEADRGSSNTDHTGSVLADADPDGQGPLGLA